MITETTNICDGTLDARPVSLGSSRQQRHALPPVWNRTKRDYPLDKCIPRLFEDQVARTPDAVAALCGGQSLTYRDLNARANRLAGRLRTLGVGPDLLVGVCMERSLDMLAALLGILKAGGAYVPMDPRYPQERLRFILADAGLKVLLTRRELEGRFPDYPFQILHLDEPLPDTDPGNPACLNTPDHLAYIIYTSGSTGKPKGVAIEHHNAVSFLCWVREAFTDEELSGVLGGTSICFDLSVFELFGTLCWGGKVILVDSALEVSTCPHRQEVNLLISVPSVMQTLLKARAMPPSVVTVNLAGEPLRAPLVDALHAHSHIRHVNDLYGPSETTTYSTWAVRQPRQPATIGRPIANTRVYILDAALNPVAAGHVGELFIGGEGVARGYLNAPELTAEKFIPDPFGGKPGARLYRTGDMVRHFPDGNLEYLGRADHQVKIRGFRVEPGEIESALSAHPELAACAVVARAESGGEKSLAAFVVAREGAEPSVGSLRTWLAALLPAHMIPARCFLLRSLPLTPNGKLDRKALETLKGTDLDAATEPVPPRNDLERELVAIWERLLGRRRVGIRDNFFELGGDSLLAVELAAEIQIRWGQSFPVATMFQSPVIEELAHRLTVESWSPSWRSLVPMQTLGSKPPLFLIHGWAGDVFGFVELARQMAPDQPVYGLQAVGLDGKEPQHSEVATMAAHYAREIRAFQPEGPYLIGGYSAGGVFAFEVAQELHRLGQRVSMLALFDSDPLGMISLTIVPYLRGRCGFHLRRLWTMPHRERIDYCRKIWANLRTRISRSQQPSRPPQLSAVGCERQSPENPEAEDYYHILTISHRLKRYPGSAAVFVSHESEPEHMELWRHLIRGGISYHQIPGTHFEIFAPANVSKVAEALRTELADAR